MIRRTIEDVFIAIYDMIGQEFNPASVIEAFGDYKYKGSDKVVISHMVDNRHIYEVNVNHEYAPVIEITIDCDNIVKGVEW